MAFKIGVLRTALQNLDLLFQTVDLLVEYLRLHVFVTKLSLHILCFRGHLVSEIDQLVRQLLNLLQGFELLRTQLPSHFLYHFDRFVIKTFERI